MIFEKFSNFIIRGEKSACFFPLPQLYYQSDIIVKTAWNYIEMKKLRTYEIIDYLKERKYCSVQELIDHFQVSAATMYRDISDLVARDVVQKVHGGIAFRERQNVEQSSSGSPFQERINWNRSRKEMVAMQALERISDNDILFLDSSTTVCYLAKLLENSNFSNLTIVTNSVTVIQDFHKFPSHYVRIGLGGSFDLQLNSFLGRATLRELEYLEISKAFISAFGVGDDKVTTNHEYHASLLMKVLEFARQKYLLVDKSKFDRSGIFKIASIRAFDEILSD